MEPSGFRKRLRTIFPDHCAIWFYGDGGDSAAANAAALHQHATRLMLKYNRMLNPLTPIERFCRIVGVIAWPVNALIRSAIATRVIRRKLPEPVNRQPIQIFLMCWYYALRYNIAPIAFYKFRIFLDANRARVRLYLHDHEMAIILRVPWNTLDHDLTHIINDKMEFHKFFRANGVATAPVLACCSDGKDLTTLAPVDQIEGDVIMKYTNSAAGDGVELVAWNSATRGWQYKECPISAQQLMSLVIQKSIGRTAILQPRLVNHPAIRPLAGSALSTVRMLTAYNPNEVGAPRIASAALRMSTGNAAVDNMAFGGIGSPINIENGTLSLAVGEDVLRRRARITCTLRMMSL